MSLAVIPPSIHAIAKRWRVEAAQRKKRTPSDLVAEAIESNAAELEREIQSAEEASRMLTASEYASLRKVAPATVRKWCATGEITGATQTEAGEWMIPSNATRTRKRKTKDKEPDADQPA